MKISYKHLIKFIPSKPSIEEISKKLFQLGHEHEIYEDIFDMELTPNRGDCLSINGLLRDLAVFFDIATIDEIYSEDISPLEIDFINNAPKACPNISFLKIDIHGDVKPYQGLFKDYFDDLNISKNNFFTDVSNYISYEMGQPTHCYDATKINQAISLEIIKDDYDFEPLIGKKIKLTDKNLAFFQGNNKIINLAGIMGSADTSCSSNTKSVIVECAYFNPEFIVGKSVKYDINSDAAHKFERGADPHCHEKVLRRFIKIVENHASIKDLAFINRSYETINTEPIVFDEKKLNKILGTSINKKDIENYLLKLGFKIFDNKIISPSHRSDINSVNDIAEEIARVVGYDNIQALPFDIHKSKKDSKNSRFLEVSLKNMLIEHGFYEVINNPFVQNEEENSIKVDNPLDSNRNHLRTNLQNSLVDNLLYNEKRQQDSVKLFEISDLYFLDSAIQNKRILGIICSGRVGKNYVDFSKKIDEDYLTNIFKKLSDELEIKPILVSRENLKSKLKNKIVYVEIELKNLKNLEHKNKFETSKNIDNNSFVQYQPISNFPSSSRDLSFAVKSQEGYQALQDYILNYKNDLIKEIFVFDFFNNRKNHEIKLGVRIIFQSNLSTITEGQVNDIMQIIEVETTSIKGVSIPGLNIG